jgi:glucosamine--fructose-6-phosphate aminotransferase (isomerizing)
MNWPRPTAAGPSHGPLSPRMLREIYQQPESIRATIRAHTKAETIFPAQIRSIENVRVEFRKVIIAASGSSRHAGLAGEIMIEDLSGIPVDVEYASEYCYRSAHAIMDPIVVVITQSGETADTIAAQREALHRGAKTIAISNVADSTISREASVALLTAAAPETAIPATKSFTAQLTLLHLLALFLARKRGRMSSEVIRTHLEQLRRVPDQVDAALEAWDAQAAECAARCEHIRVFLYLGRSVHYAIAREGALKIKEVSYVQAEGLPAGELRHGPNAVLDEHVAVVVLATRDAGDPDSLLRHSKTLGTIEHVRSSGAKTIAIATEGDDEVRTVADEVIYVPPAAELLLPILEVIPLQLLAYHFAVRNACDADHPRHLVKAVVSE